MNPPQFCTESEHKNEDPNLWPLSLSPSIFYSMLPLKSGSSLEWFELDEATSDILVTDGKRLAWCQFIKPVGWKVTKIVLFYFQEESGFLSRLRM